MQERQYEARRQRRHSVWKNIKIIKAINQGKHLAKLGKFKKGLRKIKAKATFIFRQEINKLSNRSRQTLRKYSKGT